jgi:hypothetical protein
VKKDSSDFASDARLAESVETLRVGFSGTWQPRSVAGFGLSGTQASSDVSGTSFLGCKR